MSTGISLSVAIPSFERGEVLVNTIGHLLDLDEGPAEILVVDQTPRHSEEVETRLRAWNRDGTIRWERLAKPSIPCAMNRALMIAQGDVVLFLDDDIVPEAGLCSAHWANYREDRIWVVTGRVLQPGQMPKPLAEYTSRSGLWRDLAFPFNSDTRRPVANAMAGNLSVRRARAVENGGFDENFMGDAYRFETEFCRRLVNAGGTVMFDPAATIRHLQAPRGGVRAHGTHIKGIGPEYAMGEYYFALRDGRGAERYLYALIRVIRSVRTRYHLTHPWAIPKKVLSEVRGFLLAKRMARLGPRLPFLGSEHRVGAR